MGMHVATITAGNSETNDEYRSGLYARLRKNKCEMPKSRFVNARPHIQKPATAMAELKNVMNIVWAAFLSRHNRVVNRAKPAGISSARNTFTIVISEPLFIIRPHGFICDGVSATRATRLQSRR